MRIRMNDEREERLRRLQKAPGEKTKAGAIDVAVKHYLGDLRQKEDVHLISTTIWPIVFRHLGSRLSAKRRLEN